MTDFQIISWILLSIYLESEQTSVKIDEIKSIADGINHAVPTDNEIRFSLNWLIKFELIESDNREYRLTVNGRDLIEKADKKSDNTILSIWTRLEKELQRKTKPNI